MPTMPLEREAAYNNWRKTFSDLQVENQLFPRCVKKASLRSENCCYKCALISEAGGEGGEVCLTVNNRG